MKQIVTVDPGASGGIAYADVGGTVNVIKMPKTITDLVCMFKETCDANSLVIIEKVGGYMPGNSGPASVKFARHCGHIEAVCAALGLQTDFVSPQKWMKKLAALPKDKKERKNKIKEIVQLYYPHIKVTLWNADCLGMMKVFNNQTNDKLV